MSDMIDLIQRILDNGHGYVVTDADGKPTGNVYFDVASWPHYGELTHQKQTSEVDEAAAVADRMGPSVDATGADKYNPVDPADASPTSMIRVISPCGRLRRTPIPRTPVGRRRLAGRPGWHIECSAMSHRYLAMASTFTAAAWICASPPRKRNGSDPCGRLPLRCALDAFGMGDRQGREDVEVAGHRPVRAERVG